MDLFIIIILLFLLAGLICAIYCVIEAHMLEITYAQLNPATTKKNDLSVITKSNNEYSRKPLLTTLPDNLKIIYFSDLHSEFCFIKEEKLESVLDELINKYQADVIAFGGDICNKPKNIQKGIIYFNKLSSYCQKKNIPLIGTTGNHDVLLTNESINKCGFININNEAFIIKGFELRGVHDSGRTNRIWGNNPFSNHENTNILLSHNPDWIIESSEKEQLNNIDYMLSGHIHGGQIRMPFAIENKLFRKDLLPKRDVVKGVFDGAGVKFFISKGIGCVLVPFRFLTKPEITLIEIPKNK